VLAQDHPLLPHLDLVDSITGALARRRRLSAEEAEEFAAEVRLILCEDQGGILSSFQGKSSWKTYLTTVVNHLYFDRQRARWGRWRPAAVAKRMGPTAVLLDQLLHRDGISFEEAAEMLRRNHGVEMSISELSELVGKLPHRLPRRVEGEETLQSLGVEGGVEAAVREAEQSEAASRVEAAVNAVLAELSAEDRLLLQMHYEQSLPMSAIARMLGEEQKPLYRRRDQLLANLRQGLESSGVTWPEVEDIFTTNEVDLDVEYATRRRTHTRGSSPAVDPSSPEDVS
jgi:RNA polymerase sigma factor for flagellar operon FliA